MLQTPCYPPGAQPGPGSSLSGTLQYFTENERNMVIKNEAYFGNGQKSIETHRDTQDNLHRIGKPAIIRWHENGQKHSVEYWYRGKRHNENGPAYIRWNENGEKLNEEYWVYFRDSHLSEEEFYRWKIKMKLQEYV